MARRTVWIGAAAAGTAAVVAAIVGTAPAAPAARTADPDDDALHPNLVRVADFVAGPGTLTMDVPTQPGARYDLSLGTPTGPVQTGYEVTFGSGTVAPSAGARPIALDVPATAATTRLVIAAASGTPALPPQLAVRRAD